MELFNCLKLSFYLRNEQILIDIGNLTVGSSYLFYHSADPAHLYPVTTSLVQPMMWPMVSPMFIYLFSRQMLPARSTPRCGHQHIAL